MVNDLTAEEGINGFQSATFVVDWWLRLWYGVREFSDAPDCILRASLVSAAQAAVPRELALDPAGRVVELHFWNERMLFARDGRPDLAWGIRFRAALLRSLALLAEAIVGDPALSDIGSICADVPFQAFGRLDRLAATVGRFGFIVRGDGTADRPLPPDRLASFWAAILCRACGGGFRRRRSGRGDRYRLWMTRETLLARYWRAERAAPLRWAFASPGRERAQRRPTLLDQPVTCRADRRGKPAM